MSLLRYASHREKASGCQIACVRLLPHQEEIDRLFQSRMSNQASSPPEWQADKIGAKAVPKRLYIIAVIDAVVDDGCLIKAEQLANPMIAYSLTLVFQACDSFLAVANSGANG